jgi:hypothetical protein
MTFGHGGARENTGGHHVLTPERAAARADFELERARHERVKREAREYALAQQRAQYLPRATQRAAAETAYAVLSQSLRALPDRIEAAGLGADVAREVGVQINDALDELREAFGRMTAPQ